MDRKTAEALVKNVLKQPFDRERFADLVREMLNHADFSSKGVNVDQWGSYIYQPFRAHIHRFWRIAKYKAPNPEGKGPKEEMLDVLIVQLKKGISLGRARTMQRNFVAAYLNDGREGSGYKSAALVAFVSPDESDWRFSFIRMEYEWGKGNKPVEKLTPARRYSFLVGERESSHTAQKRLCKLLQSGKKPALGDIEDAFSVEPVTKEFFEQYEGCYKRLVKVLEKDKKVPRHFQSIGIKVGDFAKKLMGQIVFLYFLQKKGWLGVDCGAAWGTGSKDFLRELFKNSGGGGVETFYDNALKLLFYDALRIDRSAANDYYKPFNCRIPFLNGGLFDPIEGVEDIHIKIPNSIFSNKEKNKAGDEGTGILDVFDRYNFTAKEDEPLEKEVAIDPEMLGKVFENLLAREERKGSGTYYTPREIVHYMCQQSLAQYLATELGEGVPIEGIQTLIKSGEVILDDDEKRTNREKDKMKSMAALPSADVIPRIDEKLKAIRICDPAVGSGAFPVGMMQEIVRIRMALAHYAGKDGDDAKLSYQFKKDAIRRSLYGVDIEASAVDIAKLRLWLSLIVDQDSPKNIDPLPNLDYKIVHGDSLLSIKVNFWNKELIYQLEKAIDEHFGETDVRQKEKYRLQIERLIGKLTGDREKFCFEVNFPGIFRRKKGFDVVIGNPPYKQVPRNLYPKDRFPYSQGIDKGKQNLYKLFVELSYRLARDGGVSTMIVQSSLMCDLSAAGTRQLLLNMTDLQQVVEFPAHAQSAKAQVFKSVSQGTCIYQFVKRKVEDLEVSISIDNDIFSIAVLKFVSVTRADIYELYPKLRYLPRIPLDGLPILKGILSNPQAKNLGNISSVKQGDINLTNSSADFSEEKTDTKLMRGDYVSRYHIAYDEADEYILEGKQEGKIFWNQKIQYLIAQQVTGAQAPRRLIFALQNTKQAIVWGNSVSKLRPNDDEQYKYLLGVLNSKLMDWVFRVTSSNNHVQSYELTSLPILMPSSKEQEQKADAVESLVVQVLQATQKGQDTTREEEKIDHLVYQLYGLTPAETDIIEGMYKRRKGSQ